MEVLQNKARKKHKACFGAAACFAGFYAHTFLPTGLLAGIVAFLVKQEASFLIIGLVGFFAAITGGVSMVVATPFICNVTNFSWTRLFLFARESFDTKPAQDPVEFMYKPEAANGQI